MAKANILAAYETMAKRYNELIDHKPHNAYYDRPNTLSLLPAVKGKKVLDAACGPGKYAQILLDGGAEVIGFDLSPKMVELAKQRNQGRGHFFVQDLSEPLDRLANESFDIVLCTLAMHYVEDWTLTVNEFHRVLQPNGIVIISIEHPFFEYQYFKSEQYFNVEAVSATWTGFGGKVTVDSFRRPLHACIQPFTQNGFLLKELIEPKPVAEFEKIDPKHFKELNDFPAFMCLSFIKQKEKATT